MISVVVPTIKGREHWLQRCLASYQATSDDYEVIVVHDKPTCGIAWNEGYAQASGDYIHFTADDIEAHPGWWQAAKRVCDMGLLPCPRVLNSDGSLQTCGDANENEDMSPTAFTRVPFLTRQQAQLVTPIVTVHYHTDVWVSEMARHHGIGTVVCRDYLLTHHMAPEGRHDTPERLQRDIRIATRRFQQRTRQ